MSKTVNKEQINVLFGEMLENADIARGFLRENKTKVSEFWESTKNKLNSVGPPVKTTAEWKKVWLDQKIYLRKKASSNMQYKKGTGGGPYKEYKFSAAEESILEMLGTKEAADGVEGSKTFGLKCTKPADELEVLVTNEEILEPPIRQTNCVKKRKTEMTTAEIAMIGVESQKTICEEIVKFKSTSEKHYGDVESSFRRIYRALDKISEHQKLSYEEMKRHNQEMESLRKKELDLKKSEVESSLKINGLMMEIEELKLRQLQNINDD